jgi:hypothetical protein
LLSLAFEATALALLLRMLAACGRSHLWVALYWWNPIVIKELSNSLHMEFMLLPIVLAASLLAIRGRHIASVLALAVAVGTKVWPALLLPLLLRPLSRQPAKILAAVIIFALVCACWAIPIVLSGLDDTSGFVAFAKRWQTNSALFQSLNSLIASIGHMIALTPETSGLLLRGLLAAIAGLVGLLVALEHTVSPLAFLQRAALVIGALFLLSPAQFPWYGTWVICLLPFVPLPGLLAMTVTLPIYYVSFHLAAVHRYDIFNTWFLWVIWIPVWLLLARDAYGIWRRPLEWKSDAP